MNMIKSRLLASIVAVLAVLMVIPAGAQNGKMYSYTDENGTVVFTDQRPPDQSVQAEPIPPGPPPQGGNPYAQAADGTAPSAAQQRREQIAHSAQESRQAHEVQEAQCAAWKEETERLEPHRRHYYTNDEGETVRMDDVERANRVAELKEKIAANCR
jgi:hypothetical protein